MEGRMKCQTAASVFSIFWRSARLLSCSHFSGLHAVEGWRRWSDNRMERALPPVVETVRNS
jgi:hypothetical protein